MREISCLKVSLINLASNVEDIRSRYSQQIMAMVKSNAYGHGDCEITRFLHQDCGVTQFGVASFQEGLRLRHLLRDSEFEIFIFSETGLHREQESSFLEQYKTHRLTPVLSEMEDLQVFLESPYFASTPLVLKFDTGMHRLGFWWPSDGEKIIRSIRSSGRKSIEHVMSHMACSGDPKHPLNQLQAQRFEKVMRELKDAGLAIENSSLANSGALENNLIQSIETTHIRPGLNLYGAWSSREKPKDWNLKSISTLECGVRKVFDKTPNWIGYGATPLEGNSSLKVTGPDDFGSDYFEVDGSSQVVLLELGYGDGLPFQLSGYKWETEWGIAEIVGRLNMDLVYVRFTRSSVQTSVQTSVQRGDQVKLWQSSQDLAELGTWCQSHPYALLSNLLPRVPRIYVK